MNITYMNAKRVIQNGDYTPSQMKTTLDFYLMYNRITQDQYQELMDMVIAAEVPKQQ